MTVSPIRHPTFTTPAMAMGTETHAMATTITTKFTRALTAGLLGTLAVLVLALGAFGEDAQAAPALDVGASLSPHELSPNGGPGKLTVSLVNSGDAPTAGAVTITASLPAPVTASSAADTSGFGVWNCSIAAGGHAVTCTGPNLLPFISPGSDVCSPFLGSACPIEIAFDVPSNTPKGALVLGVEACGGGAPTCGTVSTGLLIRSFGDDFGIGPINGHPLAREDVPAIPGDHAFWAGACDRAAAPPLGAPIPDGVGSRSTILAPDLLFGVPFLRSVSAPEVAEHCIDTGAVEDQAHRSGRLWRSSPYCAQLLCPGSLPSVSSPSGTFGPSWRLAAETQAGSHPDGSTTMAFRRSPGDHKVDGAVDDIVVDLPPGFVGNPNAVRKCTAEQFDAFHLECPPESQVGIARLNIAAVGFGGANIGLNHETAYPVYNLQPRKGKVAELGFGYASGEGTTPVRLVGKARTSGDFGVTAFAAQIPAALPVSAQSVTLWGVPWAAANDQWRSKLGHFGQGDGSCSKHPDTPGGPKQYIPPTGLIPSCRASYDPSWGDGPSGRAVRPFLTQETDCNPSPVTRLSMDSYQHQGSLTTDGEPNLDDANWKRHDSPSPAVTGCADLPFAPDISFSPTNSSADGATGLHVELGIPQNNDPKNGSGGPLDPPAPGASQAAIDGYVAEATSFWKSPAGRAAAHLKDTVATLPAGMSVNPSAAAGLQGCGDSQIGVREQGNPPLFNNGDPFDGDPGDGAECPQGSIIGTARVETPVLDEVLTGQVVLGMPKSTDPASGEMFRLFLVVRNEERGLIAKIYGSSTADPQTGQLTTRFLNNPELPFHKLTLDVKGGDRGLLAQPQRCASHGWGSTFVPWSAAHGGGGHSVGDEGAITTDANCAFGFAPKVTAGTSPRTGRASSTFEFAFSRGDGEQWLRGLTTTLPTGLLASVKDVPLCTNAQARSGSCTAGSRIGSVDAGAGSGSPFYLERKGDVYLTEGYKGGAYGLMVRIPVEAGPFRGSMALSPIIVRQALHVDRSTAQVTVISDPFPLIHHGILLRARHVIVSIDRPGFALNPSGCAPKATNSLLTSAEAATSSTSSGFQAAGCGALAFKPKLALRLTGKRQVRTGKHPAVRARVTQEGVSEAGIERVKVTLPKSLALDPENAQALCEFDAGTKPDLESHCPKGSVVGRARAVSPLLKRPLAGNVYFVKNVRIDKATGNEIRTLPMVIVALRGEIAVNLRGESSTTEAGKLVNTFSRVPDAPITRFDLNLRGGRDGILAVTRTRKAKINLCNTRQTAVADIDGHNGRRADQEVRMKTPCAKNAKAKARLNEGAGRR
jgi:hypothetical protein